jgi:hypothetical protein
MHSKIMRISIGRVEVGRLEGWFGTDLEHGREFG